MRRQRQGNRGLPRQPRNPGNPQGGPRNPRNIVPANNAHPAPANNAQPVPAVQPPVVPAQNQPVRVGYAQSARLWRPRISPSTVAYDYYKARWSVDPETPKFGSINNHAIQAMERSCAIVETLAYMYQQGLRNVLNVYADLRETKFNTTFNRQRFAHESEMNIHRFCPVVVPKDHTRHPTDQPWHTLIAQSDSLLFVDIYHQHTNSPSTFNPQYVADTMLQLPVGHHRASAYWIGRKFYGDCGVIPENFQEKSYAEGAWIRIKGQISYRASPQESYEYLHDPCDWIWNSRYAQVDGGHLGTFFLSWTEVRVVGSMHVIHFTLSLTGGLAPNSPLYPYKVNMLSLPVPASVGWRGWLQSRVPQRLGTALGINETIRVFKPLLEVPLQQNLTKRKVQYNLTLITQRLSSSLLLRDTKVFYECFPDISPANDLHRIAIGVQVYDLEAATENLVSNAAQNGATQTVFNTYLGNTGAAPSSDPYSWYAKTIPIATTVAAGVFLASKYYAHRNNRFSASILSSFRDSKFTQQSRIPSLAATLLAEHLLAGHDLRTIAISFASQMRWRPLIANFVMSCVISPLGEEWFKRIGANMPRDNKITRFISSFLTHVLPVGECLLSIYFNSDVTNVVMRILVLALHYRWTDLEFWQGVFEHSAWNQIALVHQIASSDEHFNYYFGFASIFNLFRKETPTERYLRQAKYVVKETLHQARTWSSKLATYASVLSHTIIPPKPSVWSRLSGYIRPSVYSTLAGVGLYMLYRRFTYVPPPARDDRYEIWRETYYNDDWSQIPEPTMDVPKFTCPVTNWMVPMSRTSSVPTRPDPSYIKRGMRIIGDWLPDLVGPQQFFYHTLPTCVPTYVAQKTYSNLNSALSARVLVLTPLLPHQQAEAWRRLREDTPFFKFFLEAARDLPVQQHEDSWNDIVDDWVEHMTKPVSKKRYLNIVQCIREKHLVMTIPRCTPVFVKNNEALMQCKDGNMALKPRIICNVDPLFSAFVGPFVYQMQKQLSSVLYPVRQEQAKVFEYEGKKFYLSIHYAGAALDSDLTAWADSVVNRTLVPLGCYGLAIMVSGDDQVDVIFKPDSYQIAELDAGMFDITNSTGPLKHEQHINVALGIPPRIASAIFQETHLPMAARPHQQHFDLDTMYVDRKDCPTRPSGGTNTSTGNGCVSAQTSVAVFVPLLFSDITHEKIEQAFADYGFKMKLKMYSSINGPTFLKGMWYPTVAHGNVWAPLPSRFLKVGKAIPNLLELYGEKNVIAACDKYHHDLALSFSTYMPIPLMDAFVYTYKKGDVPSPRCKEYYDTSNPFKIQGSGQYRDAVYTDEAYIMIQERYGIDKISLLEARDQILDSCSGTLLSHPVYVALWRADYA